jgi:type VI secretion system protein ImpC
MPVEGFMYEEQVGAEGKTIGAEDQNFLWGNAAYALGQRITNAFAMYGWCAAIRGVEGGGLVENLPVHVFKTSDGDLSVKTPTEVAITDRRENELSELGFIGLCYRKNSGQAAFFGGSTANKPKVYNLPSATANARLSAQLPYILATSRFAHYIKVMMRDKIGSFMTKDNVSAYLNNWVADYVLLNDDAGQETKARLPLREARIDVTDVPGKPGAYRAVVFLKPHFQLNELSVSMRLVADLPPPAA